MRRQQQQQQANSGRHFDIAFAALQQKPVPRGSWCPLQATVSRTTMDDAFYSSVNGTSRTLDIVANATTTVPTATGISSQSSSMSTTTPPATTLTTIPSYKTLLVFIMGTVAIWLSEPLLSLVDTTVVGMSNIHNSVLPLAAMGPATVLNDLTVYSTYFLALATTSQLTQSCHSQNYGQCQQQTRHVLTVALVTGIGLSGVLFWGGPIVLRSMILGGRGTSAASPALHEMTRLAISYCQIRAIAAPAAVVNMVAQAVCLATVDVRTPVVAVLVASVVNIIGDILGRNYQLVGVATATAIATCASCTVLLRAVLRKLQDWKSLEQQQQQQSSSSSSSVMTQLLPSPDSPSSDVLAKAASFHSVSTTTSHPSTIATPRRIAKYLHERWISPVLNRISWLSWPGRSELWELVRLSLPLAFNMWAKMGCYFGLTWRSSDFGPVAMASHNILMRLFFFFGCFGDALSQTAQSYLPATLYPVKRHRDFTQICQRLAVIACAVALFNFVGCQAICGRLGGGAAVASRLFTNDIRIIQCLRDTCIWTALTLGLHPIVVTISGTVIATKNFSNLIKVYIVTALTHFYVLSQAQSFGHVWRALVIFQVVRLSNYLFWSVVTPQRSPQPSSDTTAAQKTVTTTTL